jgi:hypothetical protein
VLYTSGPIFYVFLQNWSQQTVLKVIKYLSLLLFLCAQVVVAIGAYRHYQDIRLFSNASEEQTRMVCSGMLSSKATCHCYLLHAMKCPDDEREAKMTIYERSN